MKEWKTGDKINAEDMNRLETGVASSALVLETSYDEQEGVTTVTNATFEEIKTAYASGRRVVMIIEDSSIFYQFTVLTMTSSSFDMVALYYNDDEGQVQSFDHVIFFKQDNGSASDKEGGK